MKKITAIATLMILATTATASANDQILQTPKNFELVSQIHQITAILQTSSMRGNLPIKGTWEVARTVGALAHDPAVAITCAFRHYDTEAKDAGKVKFAVLVDGKTVSKGKATLGKEFKGLARLQVTDLDLSKYGADSVLACRAKVSSPTKVAQSKTAILSYGASGSADALARTTEAAASRAKTFEAAQATRVPNGFADRPANLRVQNSVTATPRGKSASMKGTWVGVQRLGALAGGSGAQVSCQMGPTAVLDKPVKGAATATVKIGGKQVWRERKSVDGWVAFYTSGALDLSDYDEDDVLECQIDLKAKATVPAGTNVTMQTGIIASPAS